MKKLFRYLGFLLLLIFILGLVGFLYIYLRGIPTYEVELPDYTSVNTLEAVERGEKLTKMLCAGCHINAETGKLSGGKMEDAPKEFGDIFAPNITNNREFGIGDWTDAELLYLFRTGVKRDGRYAPPYMAKLTQMADQDINAIIAFLRSDHSLVSDDPTVDTPSQPSFLTKMLSTFAWKPFPMPSKTIEMPDTSNQIEFGKYLAINLDCFSCHSQDFKTNNFMDPEKSIGYFGGGNKVMNRKGETLLTSNLTSDIETGIGNWTEDEFIKAVKYGIKNGEPALRYPMMPYVDLTEYEINSIFKYLKSIPSISNKIDRTGNI